jgi:hypothetical protein
VNDLNFSCPNCSGLGVLVCEIDSKTEGCPYEWARCVEVSGLFIGVACFGKLWARTQILDNLKKDSLFSKKLAFAASNNHRLPFNPLIL